MCEIFAGLSTFYFGNENDDRCYFNFNTVMNSIKILDSLELHSLPNIYLKTLLPKFDLSQIKEILVDYGYFFLKREILELITPSSLEKLAMGCISGAEINPALLVFQKCPNIKRIQLSASDGFNHVEPVLTKNVLKEILHTKREKKIEYMYLGNASEVDRDDFMNFMNNHFAFNCEMALVFRTHEIYEAFDRMLAEIQEIRQKESKISEIKVSYMSSRGTKSNVKFF